MKRTGLSVAIALMAVVICAAVPAIAFAAPHVTITQLPPINSDGWESTATTVTINAIPGPTGAAVMGIDYGLNCGVTTSYTAPFQISTEGTTQVVARATDASGAFTYAARDIRIDWSAPDVGSDAQSTYVNMAIVNVSATDAVSGVKTLETNLDGAGWIPNTTVSTGIGPHTLQARALDYAGNEKDYSVSFSVVLPAPTFLATTMSVSGPAKVKKGKSAKFTSHLSAPLSGLEAYTIYLKSGKKWLKKSGGTTALTSGAATVAYKPRTKGSWKIVFSFGGHPTPTTIYGACSVTKTFKVN